MSPIFFSIIAAVDQKNGIGKEGSLPWSLPGDLKHFKEITTNTQSPLKKNVVVMGRKTWESLPVKSIPLAGRVNIVLTRNKELSLHNGVLLADSLENAFLMVSGSYVKESIEKVFVIGGAEIFKAAFEHGDLRKIYLTRVFGDFNCDAFLPAIPKNFTKTFSSPTYCENRIEYRFEEFNRV